MHRFTLHLYKAKFCLLEVILLARKSIGMTISGALSVASRVVGGQATAVKQLRATVMTLRNAYMAQKNIVRSLRAELDRANKLIEMLTRK